MQQLQIEKDPIPEEWGVADKVVEGSWVSPNGNGMQGRQPLTLNWDQAVKNFHERPLLQVLSVSLDDE